MASKIVSDVVLNGGMKQKIVRSRQLVKNLLFLVCPEMENGASISTPGMDMRFAATLLIWWADEWY